MEQPESLKNYWYPSHCVTLDKRTLKVQRGIWIALVFTVISSVFAAAAICLKDSNVLEVIKTILDGEIVVVGYSFPVTQALIALAAVVALLMVISIIRNRSKKECPVYIVDFSVHYPPDEMKMSKELFVKQTIATGMFTDELVDFQKRVMYRTGLGDDTYLPSFFMTDNPSVASMELARKEAIDVIVGCCDSLFSKTGLRPEDINFVVSNCSLFCPTPSISAMIMNHYKMGSNVKNFQLGGMGCSAGLISIDLARDLLAVYPNSTVLVFSTENITMNWYGGDVKGMLLSNTLFRVGGAAILLTNRTDLAQRAKYQLVTTVRVNTAASDEAYHSIYQQEDSHRIRGVKISRELSGQVQRALTKNFSILGRQILPLSEQIRYVWALLMKKIAGGEEYMPNFRKAFDHICIHAGGRAIIDGLEEAFKLTDEDCMPSRATLFRFGNTSSSSVWYELNYIEGRGDMHRGDITLQIAFGSGIKCNSVVFRALHTVPSVSASELPKAFSWL